MSALKWIVKEAKAIKKAYPNRFAKWTDYVAQASAIYSKKHKGVSPVGKKKVVKKRATKKKISGVKDSKLIKKELAKKNLKMPHGYETTTRKRKISGVKKSATKKAKKIVPKSLHKDTKSHNVNIRVMSGIGSMAMDKYKKVQNDIIGLETALNRNLEQMKLPPYKTPFWKKRFSEKNKQIKSLIKELKIHAKELKKHI
jgi:hypothetical protein